MPALTEFAALARPQTVAELGAALGKPDRDLLPRGHADLAAALGLRRARKSRPGCPQWPFVMQSFASGRRLA
jgi:hypothetical protein